MMQTMNHNLSPTGMERPSSKSYTVGTHGKDSLPSVAHMEEMQRQQQQQYQSFTTTQPPQQQVYGSIPGTPNALNMSTSSLAGANWMCARSPGVNGMDSEHAGSPVQYNTYQVLPGQYGQHIGHHMVGASLQQQCQSHPGQQCGCVPTTTWTPSETTLGKKPPYSFPCLIGLALRSGETGRMSVSQIYDHITSLFPYFRSAKAGWKNSVRHNLSLNKIFCKLERLDSEAGKGAMWGITENMKEQLDRDILQCQQRYPQKIAEAMKEPEPLAPAQPIQQQQPQQYGLMGTNLSGQLIFGNSPPPGQHPPFLSGLGRASSAPTMPMVMSIHANDPNSSLFEAFASPPKQFFNQPMQHCETPAMSGSAQPQAPGSHQVLPTSRRISLPGSMEEMFDYGGSAMIDDLIQESGWQTETIGIASPTKILGGEMDDAGEVGNGLQDFVPTMYNDQENFNGDDFSDVTDDLNDVDSLLYNQGGIKMES